MKCLRDGFYCMFLGYGGSGCLGVRYYDCIRTAYCNDVITNFWSDLVVDVLYPPCVTLVWFLLAYGVGDGDCSRHDVLLDCTER
jgi:hypothetical protein